jgi:cytochrome c oxidase subunit 6a
MASRFLITRSSVTSGNRASRIIRRNYVVDAAPEEFVSKRKGVEEHAKSTANLWKKISFYIVPVSLIISSANAYMIMKQHEAHHLEHGSHEVDHPPFSYIKIRSKVFDVF